jgi:hypothetical protein
MNYVFKIITFLMLLHSTVVLSDAFKDDSSGVIFPEQLGKLQFYNRHEFPSKEYGYSLRYSDHKLKADIFIYDKGFADLEEGINSNKVSEEFEEIVNVFLEMEKRGVYSDVKQLAKETKSIGSHQFLWAKYQYYQHKSTDYPGLRTSETYLTVKSGMFIKVRITLPTEEFEEKQEKIDGFMKALVKVLYPEKQVTFWQK